MILLTGGTGFVGSCVLQKLVQQNQKVRMFSRGSEDWQDASIADLRRAGVDIMLGDIRDPRRLAAALDGCHAIVNCIGLSQSTKDASFEEIHVEAFKELVTQADKEGIQRFVHLSCLGAHEYSDSAFFKARFQSEQIVKSGKFYWTIFRPSLIFGPDSSLLYELEKLLKASPVIPVIGSGLNHIQPIWVEDVADCLVQSIFNKDTTDKTFDLVGPKSYSLAEFLQLLSGPKAKPPINLPWGMARGLGRLNEMLMPSKNLSSELFELLTTELHANPQPMLQAFDIKHLSMRQFVEDSTDKT